MTRHIAMIPCKSILFVLTLSALFASACDDDNTEAAPLACEGAACNELPTTGVRLTFLDVKYDLNKPVYVNNRVPVEYGLTATSEGAPATRQVAVGFSFVESEPADPSAPIICASSSHAVELTTDGKEQRFSGFIWPTTLCAPLVGKPVSLRIDFDGGVEVAQDSDDEALPTNVPGYDSPTVILTEAARGDALNALCTTPAGYVGCAYTINIEPTPTDDSKPLIDVIHGAMTSASSVAVLPIKEATPTLSIDSVLVVNGRDPYTSAMAADEIPQALINEDPDLVEELQFGVSPDQAQSLIAMPGKAELRYELRPSGSTDEFLPLRVNLAGNERADTAVIEQLFPGSPNTFTHELFAEGATRAALATGGTWGQEADFEVRGCFVADFKQAGNEGAGPADNDCQSLEIVLVRDTASASAASSHELSKRFDRSVGGSRLNLESGLATENILDSSGASSSVGGNVTINGNIGRSFSIDVARVSAQARAGTDPATNGYEVAVTAFNQVVYEISETGGEIVREEDFSVAKSFKLPNLGFGFGPVRIGISFTLGGEVGVGLIDSLSTTTDAETCGEALGDETTFVACGQIGRTTTPFFAFTGTIEGGVKIGPVSGGVEAELRLVNTEFPLGATLSFGIDEEGGISVAGNAFWNLELTLIQGDVSIVGRIQFKRRIMRRLNRTLRVHLFSFSSPTIEINLLDKDVAVEVLQ